MNILLTNDDGYDAPGLVSAFNALKPLGTIHVVAPVVECSACSHTITLRRSMTVERRRHELFGEAFAVSGSPADCVRLAIAELIEEPIDLVVSGINRGANAGVDTYYSGTVAAAREAAFLGLKAIAVSQAIREDVEIDWNVATQTARGLARQLAAEPLPGPGFWNVNFPSPLTPDACDRVQRVPVAAHPVPLAFDRTEDGNGNASFTYQSPYWSRDAGGTTDYTVIRDGGIAVSAIPVPGKF